MEEHINDLTAPQGGKSNKGKKKQYVNPDKLGLKDGDILKLKPEYTVAETDWKDEKGNWYNQSELTAAQLVIARQYKIVVPAPLAIMMAQGNEQQCLEAIKRLKRQYAEQLLEGYNLNPEEIDRMARNSAGIKAAEDVEAIRRTQPAIYAKYIGFKRGVLWVLQYKK